MPYYSSKIQPSYLIPPILAQLVISHTLRDVSIHGIEYDSPYFIDLGCLCRAPFCATFPHTTLQQRELPQHLTWKRVSLLRVRFDANQISCAMLAILTNYCFSQNTKNFFALLLAQKSICAFYLTQTTLRCKPFYRLCYGYVTFFRVITILALILRFLCTSNAQLRKCHLKPLTISSQFWASAQVLANEACYVNRHSQSAAQVKLNPFCFSMSSNFQKEFYFTLSSQEKKRLPFLLKYSLKNCPPIVKRFFFAVSKNF